MSVAVRIIPCLDVDKGRVVKGVRFVSLRDAGDPVTVAKLYDREGADELVFLDISASHENRGAMIHIIEEVASEIFIPFDGWRWHSQRCRHARAALGRRR